MSIGKLILLNDVETDTDAGGLLVGDSDPPANKNGNAQADAISVYLNEKVPDIDLVYSSDAVRLKKLVHKVRTNSRDQNLTSTNVRRMVALRERSFGVLNRTHVDFSSDLFSNTRIKPEKGESIFECRVRIMEYINKLVKSREGKRILLVSHPFICQIAFNAMLQKDHTYLTQFWMDKGAFAVFVFKIGNYGIQWGLEGAHNAVSNISHTQDDIYSQLLGKTGSHSG